MLCERASGVGRGARHCRAECGAWVRAESLRQRRGRDGEGDGEWPREYPSYNTTIDSRSIRAYAMRMSIPTPRAFDADLTKVPRHWLAGNAAATAISNGINMLFPHGERFFVRSVHHYLDQIHDMKLRAQ